MYYDCYPTTNSRKPVNTTVHTLSSKAVRKLLVRTAFMLLVALVAFAVGAYLQANAGTSDKQAHVSAQINDTAQVGEAVVVEQGDTLWSIAKDQAPSGTDVRYYVEKIKHANKLTGSELRIGQRLLLP